MVCFDKMHNFGPWISSCIRPMLFYLCEPRKIGLVILAGSKMDDPSLQTARTKLPILVQRIVKTLFWLVGRR